MTKSIEDMKQELEAGGYTFSNWANQHKSDCINVDVQSPDGWFIELSLCGDTVIANYHLSVIELESDLIPRAYAHLQEQRQLAALRAFVLEIIEDRKRGISHDTYHSIKSKHLAKQFNITDPKSP